MDDQNVPSRDPRNSKNKTYNYRQISSVDDDIEDLSPTFVPPTKQKEAYNTPNRNLKRSVTKSKSAASVKLSNGKDVD